MNGLRSAILSGDAAPLNTPIAAKKPKRSDANGSLTAVAVKREESRLTDQRSEERHRNLIEEAVIVFRRRKHNARVINVSPSGAMIECEIEPRIGEALEIQFAECNRTKSVVRWIRGHRIGIEFHDETGILGSTAVQDFIIGRLRGEAEREEALPKTERRPRHSLIWMGQVHFNHESVPVRVRNISADGAMIEVERPFGVGSNLLLDLDEAGTVFAQVKWCSGGQIGVKFDQQFDLKRLAEAKPVAVPPRMVRPEYLQSETSTSSPWAAMWDRLSVSELMDTLGKRRAEL